MESKFIEVRPVTELVNIDVENAADYFNWHPEMLPEFSDKFGILYDALSSNMYGTNDAVSADSTVAVIENMGRGGYFETVEFAKYTKDGKIYILREEYEKEFPLEP